MIGDPPWADKAYREIANRHSNIPQAGFEELDVTPVPVADDDEERRARDFARRVGRLRSQLLKPMYVFTMASTQLEHPGPIGKGASKRMVAAAKEIDDIVLEYARQGGGRR